MSPVGRRPGRPGTRDQILEAARALFATEGYEGASLRAIARRAGVDPALVHHYFDDKPALFMGAMRLPFGPAPVPEHGEGGGFDGTQVVRRFLEMWDQAARTESNFVAVAQAMCASPAVADAVGTVLAERLFEPAAGPVGAAPAEPLAMARRALISAHLMGLAWTRFVLRIEPVASASAELVARWAGPAIERYAIGEIA